MNRQLIFSCEHGGNQVPDEYADLFENGQADLESHRGYDPGALALFHLLKQLSSKSISSEISRLLVELNRSKSHPRLFSKYSHGISASDKERILSTYYFPYRDELTRMIANAVSSDHFVLHISVHSFTPVLDGEIRTADIGLLYDPSRATERQTCSKWKEYIQSLDRSFRVRFNYPYLGKADGLTTHLRKHFPAEAYAGIEIEVNQAYLVPEKFDQTSRVIRDSLQMLLS